MTFIDWIHSLPVWLMWVVIAFLAIWMFEMFLYPFKQNIQRKKIKDLLDIQRKLVDQLEKRTADLERTNSILAAVMSLILKREQQEEDSAAKKNKAKNGGEQKPDEK